MTRKKFRRVLATISSVAMLAGAVASPVMSASADQILGETGFDYKSLPWHTSESSPAQQQFELDDGAFHIKIINGKGEAGEKWDLQTRYSNLYFKAGHKYTVSFKAKAKRNGMQLFSKIADIKGLEEYFGLMKDHMDMGPSMGGEWDMPAELTTEYQKFSGTFTPTKDIEAAEWVFYYATGTDRNGGGNGQAGDEIWFDDMSIFCETCETCETCDTCGNYVTLGDRGSVNRDYSAYDDPETYRPGGKLANYISVNQMGYYPNLSKVAVLGDNKGDILHGASTINLTEDTYNFDVCDAKTDTVVYSGTSGRKIEDNDSGDTVYKLNFTNFRKPGNYYIKVGEWRSFPFKINDSIYSDKYDKENDMLTNAMNYFYQNRSGIEIQEKYITSGNKLFLANKGSNRTDTAYVQKIWKNEYLSKDEAASEYASSEITANGGWYDAGDYGKYVVNGGISVWTLQNMYERAIKTDEGKKKFADSSGTVVIPESGNGIPDVLDEAAYELDWMTSMVVKEDEPTWGQYAGLVYHKLQDYKWTGLAHIPYVFDREMNPVRIVKPPTFAATLNYAACSAQAARLWKPYNEDKAAKYLDQAIKAYEAYEKYWYQADLNEETREDSLYAPLYQAKNGGAYGDNEVRDDAYWAACEIFVSAMRMDNGNADNYYRRLVEYNKSFDNGFQVSSKITGPESKDCSYTTFNWEHTASAGSLTLALNKDILSEKDARRVEDSIVASADEYLKTENEQGYGIPYLYDGVEYNEPIGITPDIVINGYESGSNSMVINNAIVMAYAYDLTNDPKYISGVTTAMDYLLGTNPLSFSYITGYGTYHVENPYHKYWVNELDKTLPKAPDGVLAGGPNAGLEDPYVRGLGFVPGKKSNPSQRCYVDSVEAWSTNKVAVNWNSPLAWIVSFLQDEAGSAPEMKYVPDTTGVPVTTDPTVTSITPVTSVTTNIPVSSVTSVTTDIPVTSVTPVTTDISVTSVNSDIPIKDVKYGDVDLDGTVDLSDLIRLSQHLIHDITLSGDNLKAADCDGDGDVSITDLPRLKQFIMKEKITLGPKK